MSKLGPIANRKAESGKGLFTPNSEDGEAEKRKKKKKERKKKLYMKIIPAKRIK